MFDFEKFQLSLTLFKSVCLTNVTIGIASRINDY